MSDPWNLAKEPSSRFHSELDLEILRTFHATILDSPGNYFESLPAAQRAEIRASFVENTRAFDVVIARTEDPPADSISCDLIHFVEGEAPDRAMTRIGGLPYWPGDRPWPTNWRGTPLSFLGQINFRDSRDVVGDIPREILVMFINRWDRIRAVWMDPMEQSLIEADSVPICDRNFGTSYGVIHRTYDIPGRSLSAEAGVRDDVESMLFDLKIGGIPWGHHEISERGGSYLFQMKPPFETKTCADGTEYFTGTGMLCEEYRWPWSKGENEEPATWTLEWWAACLKRNGKLRWSWA